MAISLIVFAGFYPPARRAVQYADLLAQAVGGRLVLLHVNRASLFDPNDLVAQGYHQQELARQTDTAAILYQQAEGLLTTATVEVATDLLPAVAQDLAYRYQPALFVLSQADEDRPAADLLTSCVEILRAGNFPLLVVSPAAPVEYLPRRILIAADRESFALGPEAEALRPLLARPGVEVIVAHVSSGVEDDEGCALALRAVQASGLVQGLPVPELRGYQHAHYAQGILAAALDTRADLVVVLARQRSYLGDLFHRSVTAQLLESCPVPVLVLPTAAPVPVTETPGFATAAGYANTVLSGLTPAS
ncbi:universal stress protein [Hymenobacter arizonensis]|uniref:Nucleotide-binding universal stress protein, UspA family n=1 Tax=Hymenobacter arizonensis TaxID=1227077 RepID=A0A1I5UHE0_HYMAR|nr:universal stress protein [Hymenobacter arizonensis]SFP94598.1 Nucleotide-binding universal stress protein, UspA family [Hymenobacter arizonensis]